MSRRKMIVGNWKMNLPVDPAATVDVLAAKSVGDAALIICPPATMIALLAGRGIRVGGQDCNIAPAGPHTGEISAEMLAAAGASHVIIGHSERRMTYGETDEIVARKAQAAWRAALTAIICVGESQVQREGGAAVSAVATQLVGSVPKGAKASNTVIVYEPIWALASGASVAADDIQKMHAAIRTEIARRFGDRPASHFRILYGGPLDAKTAPGILGKNDVDGALIGDASLKPPEMFAIACAQ